jgi:ribosomal protein L7Ae-like RNA K-turn-binding protein
MDILGASLGIKRAAVVAVTDDGFAVLLKKKMQNN